MTVVHINERSCEHYRRHFDAYMDNELPAESRQVVLLHVCSCSDCAEILDSRSRMKQLLRQAIAREASPAELTKALRLRLRTGQPNFSR